MTIGVIRSHPNQRDAGAKRPVEGVVLISRAVVADLHDVDWLEALPRCQYLLRSLSQIPQEKPREALVAVSAWSHLEDNARVIAGRPQWCLVRPDHRERIAAKRRILALDHLSMGCSTGNQGSDDLLVCLVLRRTSPQLLGLADKCWPARHMVLVEVSQDHEI